MIEALEISCHFHVNQINQLAYLSIIIIKTKSYVGGIVLCQKKTSNNARP